MQEQQKKALRSTFSFETISRQFQAWSAAPIGANLSPAEIRLGC
jgi:hypothetical protein